MNAASANREQPSIVNLVDSLNESTPEDTNSSEITTDDSLPVVTLSPLTRTINLEDELLEFSTPPTCRQSSASRQDKSKDPLAVIGRCWQECVRQAELQKAQIDLLEQTKLKKKTEFDLEKTELKKELEMYKQKCRALEQELQIVREHQYASGSSNAEQHQSQRNDLVSKGTIFKSLEIFTCCICNELLIKPGVTNCNHTFCVECLNRWRAAKKDDCPVCRAIIRNVHFVNEIDEYITTIVGFLSDEAFAERLQMIEDRSSAHSTVSSAPVKRQKVSVLTRTCTVARNEEDGDRLLSFFSPSGRHLPNSTSSPL